MTQIIEQAIATKNEERMSREILLYRIGLELDGPAIGSLVGDFIRNCWNSGQEAIVNCSYLLRVGNGFVRGFILSVSRNPPEKRGSLKVFNCRENMRPQFRKMYGELLRSTGKIQTATSGEMA